MDTHLSIIHLSHREDRLAHLMTQLNEQNITDYTIMEGIIDECAVFKGISESHNQVVRLARQQGFTNTIVGEDDIKFTAPKAWEYFLNQIPESYDMFFASFYEGKVDENNRLIKTTNPKDLLAGLTLYSISSRFFDTFLSINTLSHKDKALGAMADNFEFYVAPEFCAIQLNGYSDQKKTVCNYDRYLKGRKLFGVNQ